MKRIIPCLVVLFLFSACGRLDGIPYLPSQTPETWLQIQPYAEFNLGSQTIIFIQPSTSVIQSVRQQRGETGSKYYAMALTLSPQNSTLWGEWSILFLDVLDMASGDKLKPMKNLLSASNVELFVASFAASRYGTGRGMPPAQSEACLRELASVTAGGAYFSMMEGIEGIGRRISNQIRTLYTIGFESESSSDRPASLKIQCTRPGVRTTSHLVVPTLQ